MRDLDQRLRQGLETLAPEVPAEGVFERLEVEHQRRQRHRQLRRRSAVSLAVASVAALVAAFVIWGDGEPAGPSVVAEHPDPGIPRYVTTWLPEGYQLHSVHERRRGGHNEDWLREQVFRGPDEEGNPSWTLRVSTRSQPHPQDPRPPSATVRGRPGGMSVDWEPGMVSVVVWEEEGRHYRASGSELAPEDTLRMVEAMTIRDGLPPGVELPGHQAVEDFDPQVAYPEEFRWADYTFTRGDDPSVEGSSLFSIHVHSGLGVQTPVDQPGDGSIEVEVRDRPGRLTTTPRSRLVWWEEPTVRISIDSLPPEDLLAVAEGLQRVDEGSWQDFIGGGSHQPVIEAAGTLGDLRWERNRQPNGHTYIEIDVNAGGTSVPADDPTVMPLQLDGRWWSFATTDYEIVAIRFEGVDGVRDEPASELPGAWTPPKRLYVAVMDDQPAWQTISAVLPDGTTRILERSVRPQPGRDG